MSDFEPSEYFNDFVASATQVAEIVKLGKGEKLKILQAPPLRIPQNLPSATFLINGDAVKDPKDCRRDCMGAWSSKKYKSVFACVFYMAAVASLAFRSVHRKMSAGAYTVRQIRYTNPSDDADGQLKKFVYELREVYYFFLV